MRRVDSQADNSVSTVFEVENQRFDFFFLFIFLCVFFIVFLLAGLLVFFLFIILFFLAFVDKGKLFFIHTETFVCVKVEEHDVNIRFSSPTAVAAVSGTVAIPHHCFSVEHPFGIRVCIAAFGQVMDFSVAWCVNQSHILVVPSTYANIVGENPFAIRTPLIPLITVTVWIFKLTVHYSADIFTFQVKHTNRGTVFQKRYFFTIRTELGLERSNGWTGQFLLFNICSISELFLFFFVQACLINLPQTVSFRSIHDTSSIGSEVDVAFLFRSIGDLFCCLIFHWSDVNIAAQNECYFFSIGRQSYFCCTVSSDLANQVFVIFVR